MNIQAMLRCYFVAGSQDCPNPTANRAENLLLILDQALQAGITCFQFRDKGKDSLAQEPEKQRELAEKCRDLCRKYQVPFIVNDDVELAFAIGADGIHVGQSDETITHILAREPKKKLLLGLSINNLAQALKDNLTAEIGYFGVGPIFPTSSKSDHSPAVGLDFPQLLRANGINKPLVAIGGVKAEHVAILRQNGADGVAVISAISLADDIPKVVQLLLNA